MSMGTLTMAAVAVQGTLTGTDRTFDAVSTDTRKLQPGELFFALRGEHFDAATFIDDAARIGAAGAVVDCRQAGDLPQIEVADTRDALGALARVWRTRFHVPLVAVTGSNGKTTCKEMLASILRAAYDNAVTSDSESIVLVTDGNLNNEIGLPITVLKLRDHHRVSVCEMGASHPGDIAYLANIAAPTIGVVTNAGAAHLEGFGSEAVVAATKGELFEALGEGGIAVINRDDSNYPLWCSFASPADQVTFGLHEDADYRASGIEEQVADASCTLAFDMHMPDGTIQITLPMAGRHNVRNALAAAAAARAVGVSIEAVQTGLAGVQNIAGRLQAVKGPRGMRVFDDSYNANPVSVHAAIEFLADRPGETWLVLGDMAELGPDSARLHRAVGVRARQSGITRLFCLGTEAREAAGEFGAGALVFDAIDALREVMRDDAHPGVTALVKGSRCMGLDRLVASIRVDAPAARPPTGGSD